MHLFHRWQRFQCQISRTLEDGNRGWSQGRKLLRVLMYRCSNVSRCSGRGSPAEGPEQVGCCSLFRPRSWERALLSALFEVITGGNTHSHSTKQHLLVSTRLVENATFGEHGVPLPSLWLCPLLDCLDKCFLLVLIKIHFQAFVCLALLRPISLHYLLSFM